MTITDLVKKCVTGSLIVAATNCSPPAYQTHTPDLYNPMYAGQRKNIALYDINNILSDKRVCNEGYASDSHIYCKISYPGAYVNIVTNFVNTDYTQITALELGDSSGHVCIDFEPSFGHGSLPHDAEYTRICTRNHDQAVGLKTAIEVMRQK
jgi:hypothetical protein